MTNQQTCKVCGRPDKFNFHVPDTLWATVVPMRYQTVVVCLACFDDFAAQAQVPYQSHINILYFAGDAGNMTFQQLWKLPND